MAGIASSYQITVFLVRFLVLVMIHRLKFELSAKMLATINFSLKGTVYVFQGEEIGMANVKYESIDDYKDIETVNFHKIATDPNENNLKMTKDEAMKAIHHVSRDNARTPMQWSNLVH